MEVNKERGLPKIQIDFRSCKLCPYRTKSMLLLIGHLRLHRLRTEKDSFVCYSSNPLKYKCKSCTFETDMKLDLHNHNNITHKNPKTEDNSQGIAKNYRCQSCVMETCSMLVFLKHFYVKSSRKTKSRLCELFMCSQCPYTTSNETYFKAHMILKHSRGKILELKCSLCSSYIGNKKDCLLNHTLSRHADPEDIEWYSCNLCSYRAKLKGNIEVHLLRHVNPSNTQGFQCNQCPFKTWNGFNLDKHLGNVHGEKKFKCDLCLFSATARFKLKMHITRMHTEPEDIQWFQCDQCSYKAKTSEDRGRHVRVRHPKEVKWWECGQCKFRTKYIRSLRSHKRICSNRH